MLIQAETNNRGFIAVDDIVVISDICQGGAVILISGANTDFLF